MLSVAFAKKSALLAARGTTPRFNLQTGGVATILLNVAASLPPCVGPAEFADYVGIEEILAGVSSGYQLRYAQVI
jgi:hypothetical protein